MMDLLTKKCPARHAADITIHSTYHTEAHGTRAMSRCSRCGKYFSETKHTFLAGLKTPLRVMWTILECRGRKGWA